MPTLLQQLQDVLSYNPDTGVFHWRVMRPAWNGRVYPGTVAGADKDGYIQIVVDQRRYRAHRLAWLFMNGEFPPKGYEIDHINGVRNDNRWANLRAVTSSQNNMNLPVRADNTTGKTGVSWLKADKKWHARIYVDKRAIILGSFLTFDEAVSARIAAEEKYFGEHSFLKRSA